MPRKLTVANGIGVAMMAAALMPQPLSTVAMVGPADDSTRKPRAKKAVQVPEVPVIRRLHLGAVDVGNGCVRRSKRVQRAARAKLVNRHGSLT